MATRCGHSVLNTPRSLLNRLAGHPEESDWRRLVDLYEPFIARWLGQAGVPDSDRPDLSQDVLTAVVKDVPGFRHSERDGAFRKWLRTVVVHRTRGYWRKKQTAAVPAGHLALLDQLEDPSSGISGEWDREHDAHVTQQLLVALEPEFTPTTWLAFRRQVADGLKAAEVAQELGITVNAALIAKSRVLRRLREEAIGLIDNG